MRHAHDGQWAGLPVRSDLWAGEHGLSPAAAAPALARSCGGPWPLTAPGRCSPARPLPSPPQLAQEAEAWGCMAGLELILAATVEVRRCRIVGDNLSAIRYCAGRARLRRPGGQRDFEDVLARTAAY